MSLYAMTRECVMGLMREHWGHRSQIPSKFELEKDGDGSITGVKVADYESRDPGVQDFAQELINRLSSQEPIKLAGPLTFIAPVDAPAITIIHNDGDINIGDGGFTGDVSYVTNITINVTGCSVDVNADKITLSFIGGVLKSVSP